MGRGHEQYGNDTGDRVVGLAGLAAELRCQPGEEEPLTSSICGWILGQRLRFHSLYKHKVYTRSDHHSAGGFKAKCPDP